MSSDVQAQFDSGLDVRLRPGELAFDYGVRVFGPGMEHRRLDEIRPSLRDPSATGPDPVYGIAMDVGMEGDRPDLEERFLLFGVVVYAGGMLGDEPVRSQGHIHAPAPHSGRSTPELFEIWEGRAVIYAQQFADDRPGRCVAIEAGPGDQVVVPPEWAHCVINAGGHEQMVFAALCDRQYGFLYEAVRAHGGLAWFPLVCQGRIDWQPNPRYLPSTLERRAVRRYPELGLDHGTSIYRQYKRNPEGLQWVSDPARVEHLWEDFEP